MAPPAAYNRSVARRLTGLAIALVTVVLVLVGLAISVLTEPRWCKAWPTRRKAWPMR